MQGQGMQGQGMQGQGMQGQGMQGQGMQGGMQGVQGQGMLLPQLPGNGGLPADVARMAQQEMAHLGHMMNMLQVRVVLLPACAPACVRCVPTHQRGDA